MSSEDRQRVIREAGHAPAEAEKAEGARESKEAKAREDAAAAAGDEVHQDSARPLAEDAEGPPRPRR